MKKRAVISAGIVLLLGGGLLFLPASQLPQVSINKALVKFNIQSAPNLKEIPESSQGFLTEGSLAFSAIKMRCVEIREGCEEIIPRIGEGGFSGADLEAMTEFESECLNTGCLEWADTEREWRTITLSDEQLTSLANNSKIPMLSQIKLEAVGSKIRASAISTFPIAPGLLNGEAEIPFGHYYQITKLNLGKIPLPQRVISFFEANGNGYIDNKLLGYDVILESVVVEEGQITVRALIPPGLIEEENGALTINLPEKPPSNSFQIL